MNNCVKDITEGVNSTKVVKSFACFCDLDGWADILNYTFFEVDRATYNYTAE